MRVYVRDQSARPQEHTLLYAVSQRFEKQDRETLTLI